jgi:DNA-binding response OmpR family regulator
VMPGEMDGIGLARAVRVRWPQVHVVLISAHGSVLAGVTEFPVLRKPCTPGALFAALRLEGAATTDP